jgi:hypothetical protein
MLDRVLDDRPDMAFEPAHWYNLRKEGYQYVILQSDVSMKSVTDCRTWEYP